MSCVIPFPAATPVSDDLVPLREAVAGIRRRHRRLIAAAGRWALARGLSLPADHVALWVAAVEYGTEFDGLPSAAVRSWCSQAHCRPPADVAVSFRLLDDFLADNGGLGFEGPPAPSPGPLAA